MSRLVPTRALDAVYDPVYTVSNSSGRFVKGVYRASGAGKAPAATASSNNNSSNNPTQGSAMVSGPERVKFFRRPVLPHLEAEPPEVHLAPVASPSKTTTKRVAYEDDAPTRSVGVQTMYRDSDAQTDPYTPDYTIKKGTTAQPEVLSLLHLRHNKGLPAGQAEIELIERQRAKRLFDASLPPMTDEASFLLRKSMLETQETRAWAYREAEIDVLHAQRIELLQHALSERDRENAFLAEQRVDALRQTLVHAHENARERTQQQRVTQLRKLNKQRDDQRAAVATMTSSATMMLSPHHRGKRDIIREYADFGSSVYAPVTRDGSVGSAVIAEAGVATPQYEQLEQLASLEATVPKRLLVPTRRGTDKHKLQRSTVAGGSGSKRTTASSDRKQAAIDDHLRQIESILLKKKEKSSDATANTNAPVAATRPSRLHPSQQHVARPPTPDYTNTDDAGSNNEETADAVRLLQQLLRGRAVQNMMFEGKQRRFELIQELRASDDDARRVAAERHALQRERSSNDSDDPERIDTARIVNATRAKAEGEVVSELLDYLYKALDRSKAVAAMRAFADEATAERRKREVEEGGRRQAEELVRERDDAVYRCIERVHQETAADFVSDVLAESIAEEALATAMDEREVRTLSGVDSIVTALESQLNSDEVIVKELVASFLLPQVQRCVLERQVATEQRKFVVATHAALAESVRQVKQP